MQIFLNVHMTSHIKTKDINFSEPSDIYCTLADCQAAMHYVELDVIDAYGNIWKINKLYGINILCGLKADVEEKLSPTMTGKMTLQLCINRRHSVTRCQTRW